jgi:hypothetical protein
MRTGTRIAWVAAAALQIIACGDPWVGCPTERQCLSGDIIVNSAKSCCAAGEVCAARSPNPEEGGYCQMR